MVKEKFQVPSSKFQVFNLGIFVVILCFISCNWKSDGAARLEELYPSKTDTAVTEDLSIPDVDILEISTEGLKGQWVMQIVQYGKIDVIGLKDLKITNLFIVDIPEEETEMNLTFCDQITFLDTGGLGETEIPEPLKNALAKTTIKMEIQDKQKIPAQKIAWTWGIKDMKDPFNDSIPENKDDPLVWDQDEDGKVGVTMHVLMPEGDRYMVSRTIWEFKEGNLSVDKQWISGKLSFKIDEKALDATDELLKTVAEIEPASEGNTYNLRRTKDYTCEKLVKDYTGIFKDIPQ